MATSRPAPFEVVPSFGLSGSSCNPFLWACPVSATPNARERPGRDYPPNQFPISRRVLKAFRARGLL
jgi:hypothetical protein